ncbi:MAG: hypothetical protein H6636_12680 [Anaerolineales bacterium]|nr:hypothetical protein [Anaerolineales bacterium]
METTSCPACGAHISGGLEGCEALWHELLYSGAVSGPAFDAYCMQHLDKYCASAKSYAAHLTRLCCGVEMDADPRVYAAIQKWLNGNRKLEKPPILSHLGEMTIADVHDAQTARAWMENVWAAYASQHELARGWIREALG